MKLDGGMDWIDVAEPHQSSPFPHPTS